MLKYAYAWPKNEQEDAFVPLPLATDLSAGTVVGEYTIDCKLGDGGMATVYGATHPLIGKKAAIKVIAPALSLDAGLVERFVLEARAVNAIGHPNIVDVFSFGHARRRAQLLRHGVAAGRDALRSPVGAAPRARRGARHPRPGVRRARGGARKGNRPPRLEAGQRLPAARCADGATWSSCSTSASPS